MMIELGGVYKARCGLEALVYTKVADEQADQWFVIDDRGHTWAVNSKGRLWFGVKRANHPLDLVKDTGKRPPLKNWWEYKWKAAPETRKPR